MTAFRGGGNLLKQDYERLSESTNSKTNTTQGFQPQKFKSKFAFTLAEVLITLGVIGIVAALTIPSLVSKINDKVVENQKKVMNSKIVQGLNMLNSQENGLSKSYANSEEFVQALSKYMKISTICSADNLEDCLGYDKIYYDKEGEIKEVEVSTLTTAGKIHLLSNFLPPAGFIMGDGTPIIVSWNSNCSNSAKESIILDPDAPLKDIPTQCFAGLYDINGTRKANMYNKDVLSIGAAGLGPLGTKIDGIGYVYNIEKQYEAINTAIDSTYDSKCTNTDYTACTHNAWAGAKAECDKLGMEIPTKEKLKEIYNKRSEYPEAIPQTVGWFWSSSEQRGYVNRAYIFFFGSGGGTYGIKDYKANVLCVGK